MKEAIGIELTIEELQLSDGTIELGPLRADLLPDYVRWQNDPVVMRGQGRVEPETVEGRAEGLKAQLAGVNAHFTVYDLTDGAPRPIGTTSLLIDHPVKAAEFVIALGPEGRGRHLAARITRLALRYGFEVAGLRNIMLHVMAPNTAAIRAYH